MSGTKRKSSLKGQPAKRANINVSSAYSSSTSDCPELGVIEEITLRNFMCHSSLTIPFSQNVNFIVGKNGSGKSAIITAIVVGLGGKASSTSRGSSLKTLIKEGCSSATVQITIRNTGKEAYKRNTFGEKVIVQRRIVSDGQSYYRISNGERKLISTKKEDLVQILDQFNIQVDNPLTCLNQEMSKHFLHSKSMHDKYKFFMKSTLLEQMVNDYAFVEQHKVTMQDTLKRKERAIPDLDMEVNDKEQRFRDLSTVHELKDKVTKLKKELAWADVIQVENALKPLKREIEQARLRTAKYEEAVTKSKEEEKRVLSEFENSQNQVREHVERVKLLDLQRTEKKGDYDRIRQSHRHIESRAKSLQKQKQDVTSDMTKMQKRIKDLMESVSTNIEAEKQKREHTLLKLREDLENQRARWKHNSEQMQQFEGAIANLKEEIDEKQKESQHLSAQKQKTDGLLKSLKSNRKNRLQLFGVKMPRFVQLIEEEWSKKRFRKKPRGPIGACITLKDASMAVPVESAIRSHINAFIVDNHHDMKVLSQLRSSVFSAREASRITIYTTEFSDRVHDVSNGKVFHRKYKCVFDLLNIEDPVIANCLIDMASIETILVIPQLKEAQQVMQNSGRPPARCTQAYTCDGDEVYEDRFYSNPREPVSRFLKADVDDEICRMQQEIENLEVRIKSSDDVVKEKVQERNRMQSESRRLGQARRQAMNRQKELKGEINRLEVVEDVSPPDVKDLQDEVENYKQQIVSLDKLIIEEEHKMSSSKHSLDAAMQEWKKVDVELQRIKEILDEGMESLGKIENDLEKCKADRRSYEEGLKKQLNSLKAQEERHCNEQNILQKSQQSAQMICPERIATTRAPNSIANEISQMEQRIARDEEQHGQRDQIIAEYYDIKEKYKAIKNGLKWVRTFIEAIDAYLVQRQESFVKFRKLLSMRCRLMFDTLLQERGFKGQMQFNHRDKTVQLYVQPGEGPKTCDMRALSGGERSFSTVCFILSLWESNESPFRCLDEFDVFMDMANRRVAMEMMLEIATDDEFRQYIFLTPHEICSLPKSSRIKVWKMDDPERAQANGIILDEDG